MADGDPLVRGYAAVRAATGDVARPGGLQLTDVALAICNLSPGARVLDVGCGSGATVEHLIGRHGLAAVGVDASCPGRCDRPAAVTGSLVQARAEALPLRDGSLDAVLAECSLSVLGDIDQALAEFHRVLAPGGHLVINDLYLRNPLARASMQALPPGSCLRGAVVADELLAHVKDHGFEVSAWQDHEDALRRLTAQLIWTHGSLDRAWGLTAAAADSGQARATIAEARPSYFLLVARR